MHERSAPSEHFPLVVEVFMRERSAPSELFFPVNEPFMGECSAASHCPFRRGGLGWGGVAPRQCIFRLSGTIHVCVYGPFRAFYLCRWAIHV